MNSINSHVHEFVSNQVQGVMQPTRYTVRSHDPSVDPSFIDPVMQQVAASIVHAHDQVKTALGFHILHVNEFDHFSTSFSPNMASFITSLFKKGPLSIPITIDLQG